jgi:hypothetical protein
MRRRRIHHMLGICCKLKLRNTILPAYSSNLCTLAFKPRPAIRFFFCPSFSFVPSSPRHYFFASSFVILSNPLRQMNERTNERTSKRTNERTTDRTVTFPFSRHAHLLPTITNFLPFASFLLLLTLVPLRR